MQWLPTVVRSREAEALLARTEKAQLPGRVEQLKACYAPLITPIDDQRSTGQYRRDVALGLFGAVSAGTAFHGPIHPILTLPHQGEGRTPHRGSGTWSSLTPHRPPLQPGERRQQGHSQQHQRTISPTTPHQPQCSQNIPPAVPETLDPR